eukprot:gene12183-12320_t
MSYPELALLTNLGQHLFSSVAHQGYAHSQEQQYKADEEMEERPSNGRGRTRSGGDSRSSSAYASRHQAAEQRRRTRINERLDLLRKLVPHAERANTASFLEEKLKAQLEGSHTRLQEVATAAGQVVGTGASSHFALIPPYAGFVLPKEAQHNESSYLSARQPAAALPPLAGAGVGLLTERGSGGRASSDRDLGDFAGLADGAGTGSQSPLGNDQEDTETTVPHKKRKMLVL